MKKLVLIAGVYLLTITATAQKLPNVQEKSVRAPSDIKVDGKPTEWNNQFQAYNKGTEIYYTVSNDNNSLYLTVQATDLDIVNKIICSGVKLTINGSGKMKDINGIAITFPSLNIDRKKYPYDQSPVNLDKPENMPADAFMAVLNKQLTSKLTDIVVTGIKEIKDTISVYNPEGIKAAALVDTKTSMTCELAVPLKYLGLSVNDQKPFVYNIKLIGMNPNIIDGRSVGAALRAQRLPLRKGLTKLGTYDGIFVFEGPNTARLTELFSPTDFWGEYTLAR